MAVAGTGGRQLSHGVRDRRRSCKSQTPRPGPGRKGASARRSALFAHPHLLPADEGDAAGHRSEEHTSELQSLMRISYAVFCLKKKKICKHKPLVRTRTHTSPA